MFAADSQRGGRLRLLTHRFDLDNIQTAFDTFRDRTGGAQKVLVETPGSE